MSAAPRLVPAIEPERNATCSNCRERCLGAAFNTSGVTLCWDCLRTGQEIIAHARPASARPHRRSCSCEECCVFDAGQRGDFTKLTFVPDDIGETFAGVACGVLAWLIALVRFAEASRWPLLEVD